MSKEFFLVAHGVDVANNKDNMAASITLFDESLAKLRYGDADSSIPAPPSADVAAQLDTVAGLWTSFKALLEANIDASPISSSVLTQVATDNLPVLVQSNVAVGLYTTAAENSGASVPGAQINIAGRQRMLSQKMSKEAVMVLLAIDTSASQSALNATVTEFATNWEGLVYGSDSLPATTATCIIDAQYSVKGTFDPLVKLLDEIITAGTISTTGIEEIASMNPTLLSQANAAVQLYKADSPCTSDNEDTTAAEWSAVLDMSGRQRMLSQKMSKEFFLVAHGVDVANNKDNMAASITLFDESLAKLRYGDADSSIPAPPSADVAAQLDTVAGLWTSFKALLEANIDASPISSSVLTQVATDNLPVLVQSNVAVGLYTTAAENSGASVPGAQINIAGRQRMLSQKMSKEAVMVLLAIDTSASQSALNATMTEFATNWKDLLNGNSERSLPEMTDECAIEAMDLTKDTLGSMDGKLMKIVESGTCDSEDVTEIASQNPELLSRSNQVVQILKGSMTCDEEPAGKTTESAARTTAPEVKAVFFAVAVACLA